jgi:magnesium-transporting ATPase (P-type)
MPANSERTGSTTRAGRLLEVARCTPDEALDVLDSSWDGLREDQVCARTRRFGKNAVPTGNGSPLLRSFAAQFTHFFALTLWVCAGLAFIGELPQLGWAIIVVVTVNGVFSFVQEFRADRTTRSLAALLPATAVVRRAGERCVLRATDLVPGDILLVGEGARISADARVLSALGLRVDNSSLTGESEALLRSSERVDTKVADEQECPCLLFAGTWAVSGSAVAVVVATGAATRLGSIARSAGAVRRRHTPLHAALNRAVRVMSAIALGAGALFLGSSVLLGMRVHDGLLFSVGVIVALVPEGLLPTLSLALALGATRMARRGALLRRLEAVETLGSTTVICTDKTGTLTANQMTVTKAWTFDGCLEVSGAGYGPAGSILREGRPLSTSLRADLEPLLRTAALCSDARIERRGNQWRCAGDPTDGALVVFAQKGGLARQAEEQRAPRVALFPFDSSRRRMSSVHLLHSGEWMVLTKGSSESIVSLCATARVAGEVRPLTRERRQAIDRAIDRLAAGGLRVLALAYKVFTARAPATAQAVESELVFLGLVGMWDPIRPEVPAAVARCRAAGIRVLMLTGDHPATAQAIARHIGLAGEVRLGRDLPLDERSLGEFLQGSLAAVARVAPEQKRSIASALQLRGEVVAMTGDGVNDAPALRQADIGVAMGASGTDVAREAADMVLLDDDFSHIIEAVEEGRAAFANIRRFLTYHLTDNVAELAPFLAWALSGGSIPLFLTVLQILALDIGTDLLPALALGAEAPEPRQMVEPPRSRTTPLLDRSVLGRAFCYLGPLEAAISLSLVPLAAWLFLEWKPGELLPGAGPGLARLSTLVFASIVLMQAVNALACRSSHRSALGAGALGNRMLLSAIGFELIVLLAFVHVPAFQTMLGHHGLSKREWLLVLAAPIALLMAEELRKLVVRRRLQGRARAAGGRREAELRLQGAQSEATLAAPLRRGRG